jgi:ubiquinone/menaquinone biosynthesis C-methylase UbiE
LPDPIFPGRIGLYFSMLQYGMVHNHDFAEEHHEFFTGLMSYIGNVSNKNIIDVGCGKSFWLTLLLHNSGANVTGIDTEVVQPDFSVDKYLDVLKKNGIERALRTLIWEQVFARSYYKQLEMLSGQTLHFENIHLQATKCSKIDLPDNSIDIVVSHEVFEHIEDIPATLNELKRVMKPDAITYIYVHNYTSLSGGHHIAWKYPDNEPSAKVPPWDHLRENSYPDIPSWLNEMRENEYREEFEKRFEIVDWISTAREGEKLLSKSIRQELHDYSEHELLTKGFTVVAKPR